MAEDQTIRVAHLLFEKFWELDIVGPWDVFTSAAYLGADVESFFVAPSVEPVQAGKGMTVVPTTDFARADRVDVVVVPGGLSDYEAPEAQPLLAWLKLVAPSCTNIMSVCTGSFLLYGAGLLHGKRATTHHQFMERFKALDGPIPVDDRRYVRDGRLLTTAGVSAGIDGALSLVGELFGDEMGARVTALMEYAPRPPY